MLNAKVMTFFAYLCKESRHWETVFLGQLTVKTSISKCFGTVFHFRDSLMKDTLDNEQIFFSKQFKRHKNKSHGVNVESVNVTEIANK